MSDQIVPLTNAPNQQFLISLQVDGASLILQLSVRFDEICQYWLLGINDSGGNPLLSCIPMLCGDYPTANILGQYGYLKIGSAYVLNISGTADENPGPSGWGDFSFLWSDTAV